MDTATRLQRHSDRWQEGSSRVQRIAVGGLIFASLIFFKVIEPHAQTAAGRENLANLEVDQVQADDELARVNFLADQLGVISQTVDNANWRQYKEDLVQRFSRGGVAAPQQEADQTIRKITGQVRNEVLAPLETAVAESGLSGEFAGYAERMNRFIDEWEQSKLGQRWFQTRERKEEAVTELGTTMESLQNEAKDVLAALKLEIDAKRRDVQKSISQLAARIEKTNAEIQQALDEANPAWARGLVSVEWMVSAYGAILAGIALVLVASGLLAARHYHGMANAAGWSQSERSDPLFSSVWTLTWRGIAGTSITLLSYLGVLAGLGYFLNRSNELLGAGVAPAWLLNLILLVAAAAVIFTPVRRHSGVVAS